MRLTELMIELREINIEVVGMWEFRGKKGVTLGDRNKSFPNPEGPRYPVDTTKERDPDLTKAEVTAIRRRFGVEEA
jgi:hypothetical protein